MYVYIYICIQNKNIYIYILHIHVFEKNWEQQLDVPVDSMKFWLLNPPSFGAFSSGNIPTWKSGNVDLWSLELETKGPPSRVDTIRTNDLAKVSKWTNMNMQIIYFCHGHKLVAEIYASKQKYMQNCKLFPFFNPNGSIIAVWALHAGRQFWDLGVALKTRCLTLMIIW